MEGSKYMDVVSTGNPMVAAIVNKENGMLIAEYRLSPHASYVQHEELAVDIMQAYEKYYGMLQQKEGKP